MIRLYISGPMTGKKNKNFSSFIRATKTLRKAGYKVTSPHELESKDIQCTWVNCMRRDIKAQMECDGVATLAGWKKSNGAMVEVTLAKGLGWEVHSVEYWIRRK